MSYFSRKNEQDKKMVTLAELKPIDKAAVKAAPEQASTLAAGMLITGNIISAGSVQIMGRVVGDIHAAQLIVSEGAYVEGKAMAQDMVMSGAFKGTIHGNSVKLTNSAVVDGEIYKQTLMIDENAQFEGMSRRLEKPVEAPSRAQVRSETTKAAPAGNVCADGLARSRFVLC